MEPAEQSLRDFLSATAAATPAPGGGSAAAATCALAAALVEMSVGIEAARGGGSEPGAEIAQAARGVRERALALSAVELTSYVPVLEARRLDSGDPDRAGRVEAALIEASRSPLEIAEGAAEAAELSASVAAGCDPSVRGNALTGVLLAKAACATALSLVEVNLTEAGAAGAELLERARAAGERAAGARRAATA